MKDMTHRDSCGCSRCAAVTRRHEAIGVLVQMALLLPHLDERRIRGIVYTRKDVLDALDFIAELLKRRT